MAAERIKGTVKEFNESKGFGFITGTDGKDYFVHFSTINNTPDGFKTLAEGERVEFTPVSGDDGKNPNAIDVTVIAGDGDTKEVSK